MILMFLFVLASVSHYSPVRGAPMSTENGSGEGGLISESILILSHSQNISQITTGGPPLTRKSHGLHYHGFCLCTCKWGN